VSATVAAEAPVSASRLVTRWLLLSVGTAAYQTVLQGGWQEALPLRQLLPRTV
jgi:hypothetical protein